MPNKAERYGIVQYIVPADYRFLKAGSDVGEIQAVRNAKDGRQAPDSPPNVPVQQAELLVPTPWLGTAVIPGHVRNHHLVLGAHAEELRVGDEVV